MKHKKINKIKIIANTQKPYNISCVRSQQNGYKYVTIKTHVCNIEKSEKTDKCSKRPDALQHLHANMLEFKRSYGTSQKSRKLKICSKYPETLQYLGYVFATRLV